MFGLERVVSRNPLLSTGLSAWSTVLAQGKIREYRGSDSQQARYVTKYSSLTN